MIATIHPNATSIVCMTIVDARSIVSADTRSGNCFVGAAVGETVGANVGADVGVSVGAPVSGHVQT